MPQWEVGRGCVSINHIRTLRQLWRSVSQIGRSCVDSVGARFARTPTHHCPSTLALSWFWWRRVSDYLSLMWWWAWVKMVECLKSFKVNFSRLVDLKTIEGLQNPIMDWNTLPVFYDHGRVLKVKHQLKEFVSMKKQVLWWCFKKVAGGDEWHEACFFNINSLLVFCGRLSLCR